jgi:hypothetical protein
VDPATRAEVEYRIQHRHRDGTWGDMHPVGHHGPAAHDPERHWAFRRIFRCDTCEETVTISAEGEDPGEQSKGWHGRKATTVL